MRGGKNHTKQGKAVINTIELIESEGTEGLEHDYVWSVSHSTTGTQSPGTSSKRRLLGESFAKCSKKYYKDIRDYAKKIPDQRKI